MANTVASRKSKGRRLQQFIVKTILQLFPDDLTESDVRSTPMGCKGEDVMLSEKAKTLFPYSVEAKNVEKLNIWKALEQAESEARKEEPLLVFKRNNSNVYCALKFETLINLINKRTKL